MVVGTDNFLGPLLLVVPRLEPPEKHQDLFPAGRAIDLPVEVGLEVVDDALT